jgi:hypothetical protein
MPRSPNWSLPLRFSKYNFVCISHHSYVYVMPHLFHPTWFCYSHNTVKSLLSGKYEEWNVLLEQICQIHKENL